MSRARGQYAPRKGAAGAAASQVEIFRQGQQERRDAAYRAALGVSATQPLPSTIGHVARHSRPRMTLAGVAGAGRHSMAVPVT